MYRRDSVRRCLRASLATLMVLGLLGCTVPGAYRLNIVLDNQSSADVALILGPVGSGESYLMPSGHTRETGVGMWDNPSVHFEIRDVRDCHVVASYDMGPPFEWLVTISPGGSAAVSPMPVQDVPLSILPVFLGTACLLGQTPIT